MVNYHGKGVIPSVLLYWFNLASLFFFVLPIGYHPLINLSIIDWLHVYVIGIKDCIVVVRVVFLIGSSRPA